MPSPVVLAVEPFPSTIQTLKQNLSHVSYYLIDKALGSKEGVVKFYSENGNTNSGRNSTIKHFYLNNVTEVKQTTIDIIFRDYDLKKIDYLKLDIEGFECNALLGAHKVLSDRLIDYIQLEYNQTWISGGGTIKKIIDIGNNYGYSLYRIRKNDLLHIPSYDFILEDFFYCNLLLVRKGCKLPLKSNRKAIPTI